MLSRCVKAQDLKDVQALIFEAFNKMMSALKPGITVAELAEVGGITSMSGRAQTQMSMHGRGTGDDGPLVVGAGNPDLAQVEVKENCVMMLRSSGSLDGVSYGRWADTVVIRKNGAERLGTRPQVLYELA